MNFFVTAPASFLVLWLSVLNGVIIYGWLNMEHSMGLKLLTGFVLVGYIISFSLYNGSKVLMADTAFLSKYAKFLGAFFFIFVLSAYLWGIFGDYLRVYFFVEKEGIQTLLLQLDSLSSS